VIRLEQEEFGGMVSVNILPCRIFGRKAFILRTDSSESGQGRHPKTIIEVACDVKLRDQYNLKDGDIVEVEITADSVMDAHGQALLDYLNGDAEAYVLLHRDDGFTYPPIAARDWFYEQGFPQLDQMALDCCSGRVLDLGAAAGSHTLALQASGMDVTAVDVSPKAVEVMNKRGVKTAFIGDIYDTYDTRFNTVLVLTNIGIVKNLEGLDRFLCHLSSLLFEGGQLITDSIDPRSPTDEFYKRYTLQKTAQGRYFGERTLRFEYKGRQSEWFEWMHIDPEKLGQHVRRAGLGFEIIPSESRRYLALIKRC
jgi:SAM-dependent methyltransferase